MNKMNRMNKALRLTLVVLLVFGLSLQAEAESNTEQAVEETTGSDAAGALKSLKKLQRITVTGGAATVDLVPGSAQFLDKEQLKKTASGVDDIHRVLRQVPGVNISEEDGYGLRPNIGFRGADSERSSSITLMEDGVLLAPAPYSSGTIHFFPPTTRLEGVEILKGAGQIKYGPRTTGGSLNLLSTSIPNRLKAHAKLRGGENNTKIGHFYVGDSYKYGGFLLEAYQGKTDGFKEIDGGGDTGFDIENLLGKFRLNTDPNKDNYQELEFKTSSYDEDSNSSYLGLTEEDFNSNPFRRYAGSQLDNMDIDRSAYQLTHYGEFGDDLDITTTAYSQDFKRNWYKLDSVDGVGIAKVLDDPASFAEKYAWMTGANSPDDVMSLRNNNRELGAKGIQSVLGVSFDLGETEHEVEFGVRYHEDYEDRFQDDDLYSMVNGTLMLTTDGEGGSQSNRKGEAKAWALYVQDKISWEKTTITPGLRFESIDYTRRDWGSEDPRRVGTDLEEFNTGVDEIIPGIGLHQQLNDEFAIFAGIHRGFAPPGAAKSDEIKSEKSIAYETGANYAADSFWSELVFFMNDYENLLGNDSEFAGGSGSGDTFNAGEATTYGIEASARIDLGESLDLGFGLPVRAAYTFTSAEFDETFESDLFGSVVSGDNIPYVPENQFSFGVGIEHDKYNLYLDAFYVDAMETTPVNGNSSRDTDNHFVVDLKAELKVRDGVKIFAAVENIFDEEYVVATRPAGLRPGMPQTFFAGVTIDLD